MTRVPAVSVTTQSSGAQLLLGFEDGPSGRHSDMDVQTVPVSKIVDALDSHGIPDTWKLAAALRSTPRAQIGPPPDYPRLKRESDPFRNLIVGNIAEGVFKSKHLDPLVAYGFKIESYFAKGENRDFGVQRDGLELPINVKTASTLFREAFRTVGLQPNDCIPISAYKANGAAKRVPDLIYVDLVDFALRVKADSYMASLVGDEAILFDLFSWYGGRGAKKAQDAFVAKLFESHRAALEALVTAESKFQVISAQRVKAIVRDLPERCPGLGIKGAGTGGFNAEVNVHVSVQHETRPWDEVAGVLRNAGIQALLNMIRKREARDTSVPTL